MVLPYITDQTILILYVTMEIQKFVPVPKHKQLQHLLHVIAIYVPETNVAIKLTYMSYTETLDVHI